MAGRPLRRARLNCGAQRNPAADPTTAALAEAAGKSCRGRVNLPTDNFWYAWLIAALARGTVANTTNDKFTQKLMGMTLIEIARMADSDPSFYDT